MKSLVCLLLGLLLSFVLVPFAHAVDCRGIPVFDETNIDIDSPPDVGDQYVNNDGKLVEILSIDHNCSCRLGAATPEGYHIYWSPQRVYVSYTENDGCSGGVRRVCSWDIRFTTKSSAAPSCDEGTIGPEPEPDTCRNGVLDPDEEGIDCGGPCSAPCEEICPPNTEILIGFDGQPGCFWVGLKDDYGNCPRGTTPADDQGQPYGCYKEYPTITAAAGTEVDAVDDLSFKAGSLTTVEQVYPSTTVDNGDGTSSKTTITERVGPGGEKSTVTQTDVIDNATGDVLSSTTNIEQETPVEENPDNYSYDIGNGDLPDSDFVDLPEEKNFDSLFDQINSWNPFADMDDEMKITVANPTCSFGCDVDLGVMGHHRLEFGLCEYDWAFNAIGVVLNFISVCAAFYIVVRGR